MPEHKEITSKRRKFQEIEIPLLKSKIELVGNSLDEINGKTIKIDLTRLLKGKNIEVVVKIVVKGGITSIIPIKIKLMPYFIRRVIRKRISYVEDSFETPSQESVIKVKPFLITRKRVSRVIRKTLRNKARNWLEDYISQKNNEEIFEDILTNKMQKTLSLILKKTYPLSLCEIRILEVKRPLKPEEAPKKIKKTAKEKEKFVGVLDQLKEIEEEKIEKAIEEIKKTQIKAVEREEKNEKKVEDEIEEVSMMKKDSGNAEEDKDSKIKKGKLKKSKNDSADVSSN